MSGRPTQILQSIAGVIRRSLHLSGEQVILARQKYEIPSDSSLLVVLSLEEPRPIGNNSRTVPDAALGMKENQYLSMRDLVQIDVLAMTNPKTGANEARDKRNQVVLALQSVLSEQEQESLQYSLARVPASFANTSALEATQFLERYTATVAVFYGEEADQYPSYFDSFDAEFIENSDKQFTDAPPIDAFAGGRS